jgi:hypothetical protein
MAEWGGRVGYSLVPERPMVKRYHVELSPDDRQHLDQMISRGKTAARSAPVS